MDSFTESNTDLLIDLDFLHFKTPSRKPAKSLCTLTSGCKNLINGLILNF